MADAFFCFGEGFHDNLKVGKNIGGLIVSIAIAFDTLAYAKKLKQAGFTEAQAEIQTEALGTWTKQLPQLCITASGRLCPISNHKNLEIARYSFNFCDLRSNKFDPNLCAYLWKLIRPRSLANIIDDRLATKEDIIALQRDLKELEIRLKHDLTLRLGTMMMAGIVIVATLVKLL